MRRTFWRPAILLFVILLAPACRGGSGEGDKTSAAAIPDRPATAAQVQDQPQEPASEAVPTRREMGDAEPGILLVPRFAPDEDVTTRDVAVGDYFELYICAAHPNRDMASATYRLDVPEGVEVLGEAKLYPESLSMGTWEQYYCVTYPCHSGDEYYPVLRYTCRVLPSFTGGEISVEKAIPPVAQPEFCGFVTCGDLPEMVPAGGGAVVLTLK